MTSDKNPKLEKKVEKLKSEVADMKEDIRFLKKILLEIDLSKSKEEDGIQLKKIEKDIDDLK